MTQKATFPKIKKQPLESIHIPKINVQSQQPFISIVNKILAAKKANPATDTTAWEKEIDQMVYKLYGLTPEEIKIVEGS